MYSEKACDIDDFDGLLEDAEDLASSDWDTKFVGDIRERYDQYGDDTYISDNQLKQLHRISGRD
jgi:hypothetical protein